MGFGLRGLLLETHHAAVGVDLDDAELAGRRLHADRQRADRQIGAAFDVPLDQLGVVHLVDVVAGEDHHVLRPLFLDRVDVLVDGVGGALIPVLVDALLRRDDFDELAQFAAEVGLPAEVDVPVEAHRLVLGEDEVLSHPAVKAVRQGEVDNPISPAEGDCRLGPIPGERLQPRAFSPRKDYGQNVLHFRPSYTQHYRNDSTARI